VVDDDEAAEAGALGLAAMATEARRAAPRESDDAAAGLEPPRFSCAHIRMTEGMGCMMGQKVQAKDVNVTKGAIRAQRHQPSINNNIMCKQTLHTAQTQQSTAQHSTAQHSTAQHSTAQHSTAQHSTAQHCTAPHLFDLHQLHRRVARRRQIVDDVACRHKHAQPRAAHTASNQTALARLPGGARWVGMTRAIDVE
jgi:hypothetical protein